ncbi:MAG: hypothetical protein U5K31_14240 [Balneolaceae bacterium]|nr:hypothetical protein [Balneolaceae bacterium]
MRNDENACIRYLMKEMDPSEEVLMERAMMEDEDLLIEVESMRKTLGRLDGLPDKEPSPELTDAIVNEASDYREQVLSSVWHVMPLVRYAAAAVVLIGMSFGSFYAYDYFSDAQQSVANSQASVSSPGSPVGTPQVTPWVDRNDVLRLDQTLNNSSPGFDAIFQSATRKLTPISDPFFGTTPNRNLQLTNSSGN